MRKVYEMKLNGDYNFDAPCQRVFDALLDPELLQKSIPGCVAAWYPDADHMKVRLTLPLPLPGLEGPYDVTVRVQEQHSPHLLVLQAERKGRIGGTIETITHLTLTENGSGSLLKFETQGNLHGPVAAADNPLIRELIKQSISTCFKQLNERLLA